ncbi:uncharacterized protein LOC122341076 isoform X4 [Puntigrus tetrazona]|uniref:uncharacterized protein LOC122341076 isoform X4 n=1 Tax=Puntigrus tetrazona TaxID=1606681 RepID=UPI001C8A15EA|nr:uncharacterized protein LOC122341076 isoform X4 [Puntigrus tetrazona]
MKHCRPLICGLILSCICFKATDSYEELSVIQSPPSITVNEGDSALITCCWSKITQKVKVTWHINETKLSDVKQELYERETQNCSVLNFTNILKNATGHYVCKVTQDIPVLLQKEGSGTVLFVKDDQLTTTVNPDELDNPKRNPEDEQHNYLGAKVEHAVELEEGPVEGLEAGETRGNESEEVKQCENVSGREKEKVNAEKPEVTAATEEEKNEEKQSAVVVRIEQDASPDNENKNSSVLNTD